MDVMSIFLFSVPVVVIATVRDALGSCSTVPLSGSAYNAYHCTSYTTLRRPKREMQKPGQASGQETPGKPANKSKIGPGEPQK
jgi:hypothetical protein